MRWGRPGEDGRSGRRDELKGAFGEEGVHRGVRGKRMELRKR